MTKFLHNFQHNRRGAIAIIFALALVPLVLLVAISVDFSFFAQARSEINLAADASATHAIRAATATYALETSQGVANATAITDAQAAGQLAGQQWFNSQLGQLPTAYIATPGAGLHNPNVTVTSQSSNSTAAGFKATVAYQGVYPPFFGALFHNNANWYISGTSGASSQYSYVEVLMMLDTSGSMLIGATQADIDTMNYNSVCPKVGSTAANAGLGAMSAYDGINSPGVPSVNTAVDFTKVVNYNAGTGSNASSNTNGTCNPGYGYTNTVTTKGKTTSTPQTPYAPCAFACHTDTANSGTASQDLYGIARTNKVQLRLDVVLNATENVITDMATAEQAPNQFSVGVYQFNYDITPVVQGTALDPSKEATADLPTALGQVKGIDYAKTPSETTFPGTVSVSDDNTNFPLSMKHFISGSFLNNAGVPTPLANSGDGSTQATPQKDLFIVTDGMEDDGPDFAGGSASRVSGPMTGVLAEKPNSLQAPTGVCTTLKNAPYNYNIYVLYIYYYPLPNNFYMTSQTTQTPYFTQDYGSGLKPTTANFAEATTMTNSSAQSGGLPPDVAALQACASTPSQFFIANSAADIGNAMNQMLAAALSTTIRVVQ